MEEASESASEAPLTQQELAAASVSSSNHVYIKSDEHSWIPARLLESDGSTAVVQVPQYKTEQAIQSDGGRGAKRSEKMTIKLADYPNKALLLQNVDENGRLIEVDDMVDLPFLHEAAILYNLKVRHLAGKPYTRTGDIVIAVNPYQWYDDLYSEGMRSHYASTLVWNRSEGDVKAGLDPHVYETSSLAYRGLSVEGDDQSILVSGESGAGKTETVKILLSDIASVQRGVRHSSDSYQSPIVQRVLDSNPLLEAFGNAKTIRNDNSSRFGKYIQLQFDSEDPMEAAYAGKIIPSCTLAGSKSEVYLLEKSRVVTHEEDERTYHIFYQLLAADEEVKAKFWDGLADTDNESFSYVGYTETDTIEGKTDNERFQLTLDSLALIGIVDEKLVTLMRTICIVLQLGNVVFDEDENDDSRSKVSSQEEFAALAKLMGIGEEDLLASVTIRTMRARNEEFKVPLNAVQAKDSCDAFAKEIYAKTFLWLVRAINDATCAEQNYDGLKKTGFGIIGLLDIFGFESFETNRFEQLCINYANEKLQQKFTQDVFRSVQAEYEYEGIKLEEITYDDNTDVLDLVEGRMGLIAFLNEECVRPGGSDKGFVSKVHTHNKGSRCFRRERNWGELDFEVHHYAGQIMYDATNFVTKNMDTLPTDLQQCATRSTNGILATELGNEAMMNSSSASKGSKRKPPSKSSKSSPAKKKTSNIVGGTVWTKFKTQLTSLMDNLRTTRTRYIRCVKPNNKKEPLVMEHLSTVEQLRCAGVVAAVTISRSAFPNRLDHATVLERFRALWKKGENEKAALMLADEDLESKTKGIVSILLLSVYGDYKVEQNGRDMEPFVLGKTRAYFRAGALEYLENERLKCLARWATQIEKAARRFVAYRRFKKGRKGAVFVQSVIRMRIAQGRYERLREITIVLQCWIRCIRSSRVVVRVRRERMASLIQTHWRMHVDKVRLKTHVGAIIQIQRILRGAIQRPKFRSALIERREEAKLENQVVALQRKLEEAEARRVEAEHKAEEKALKAVEAYREQATEEKKEEDKATPPSVTSTGSSQVTPTATTEQNDVPAQVSPSPNELSAQQQTLMDESGKMLEYLRKEVFKLRSQNNQMHTDMEVMKDNNQRLMDANASAGASFAALNQHAKQLTKTNEKLATDLASYKQQVQKLSVTQVELKEELKMKQATYVAEVHSRLQYQKALSRIVDMAQDRCRDTRLVEDVLGVADSCEADYMSGPTGIETKPRSAYTTPTKGSTTSSHDSGLMSGFRALWS